MILKRHGGEAGSGASAHPSVPAERKQGIRLLAAASVALLLAGSFFAGAWVYRAGYHQKLKSLVGSGYLPNYARALVAGPSLPTLVIDMKFKHLQTIMAKRDEALRRGLLFASDEDYVPAELRFEDRTIRVKMRLKGDWVDHLETDKWSYRIQVRGDDQLLGMRRFSIQPPESRMYVHEWGFLENLRAEGILAPRYQFVDVIFNGESKGFFALEEFFAKEMMESQQRREGLFLISDEELRWARRGQALAVSRSLFSLFDLPGYHDRLFRTYGTGRIDKSPVLSRERDEAVRLLRGFQEEELTASQVFDVPLLGRYLAVVELWSAAHGIRSINSVFYYNPVTAKLEPVGFDNMPFKVPANRDPGELLALQEEDWVRRALADPELMRVYVSEIRRVSSDDYLAEIKAKIGAGYRENMLALHREWPKLVEPWGELRQRQELLRAILEPTQVVQALRGFIVPAGPLAGPRTDRSLGNVEVANIFALPVELMAFRTNGTTIPAAAALSSSARELASPTSDGGVLLGAKVIDRPLRFVEFSLAMPAASDDGSDEPEVVAVSRVLGDERLHETPVIHYPTAVGGSATPAAPTIEEALASHPCLERTADPSMLRITGGSWDIESDLVLPEGVGLEIGAATTLRFAENAVLLARGPLVFRGTADQPVVIEPQKESWAGAVVLQAGRPSTWENVIIRNTRGIERKGWILTGGITFYASPITLLQTRIQGSLAEDAINIFGTHFEFYETEISDTASDALDCDFTDGLIKRSRFSNIAGDAIDLSGSVVDVDEVQVLNIGDKGISAGEASHVGVARFVAASVGVGVASKDSSEVFIKDSVIQRFKNFGLAAYKKKPEYGPAGITAENVQISEGETPVLVQTGSWIRRDGEYLDSGAVDVKALYEAGILDN